MNCTIRSHGDLKHRDADRPLDDLPESLQAAHADAVKRGCGCDRVARLVRTGRATTTEEVSE